MGRRMAKTLLSTGALILMAIAATPALAKQCRDAAGKVVNCRPPLVTKGNNCVNLRTSQRTKCGGPDALPTVKGPVAGEPNKKPG